MAKKIIVTVDAEGKTTIATSGFAGSECLTATMALEKALGVTTDDTKTREFSQAADQGAGRVRQS